MVAGVPVAAQPLESWLRPFAAALGEATWRRALVLVAGALLASGRRTVASALRAAGLEGAPGLAGYHRVLSHARWDALMMAERLLALLVGAFVPDGPVVVALDDTLERRWGRRIRARGIYRDPVRSSHGHFVKASGLRWLALMLVVPVPWAGRAWALPFLTVLAPSERSARERGGRHKRLTDWARQALLQAARWLPGRRVVAVADSSPGTARRGAPARGRGHPAPARRALVRPAASTDATHDRAPARGGRAPPDPHGAPGRLPHPLAPSRRRGLVRRRGPPRRGVLGHRPVAPPRPASRAAALGPGARPARGVPAAGIPLHRPWSRTGRDSGVVRPALGDGGDVRRGAPASRDRDAAAVGLHRALDPALAPVRWVRAGFSPRPAAPCPSPRPAPAASNRCRAGHRRPASPRARTPRTPRPGSIPGSADVPRTTSRASSPAAHSTDNPCAARRRSRPSRSGPALAGCGSPADASAAAAAAVPSRPTARPAAASHRPERAASASFDQSSPSPLIGGDRARQRLPG